VFAKSMSEPIEDCGEVNEAEEGFGEFVVAGGDAALDFDPPEEVFDLMAAAIVTAMKAGRLESAPLGWDAAAAALAAEAGAKDIGIEAFVSDDPAAPRASQHGLDGMLVMLLPRSETQRHRPATSIDDCGQFGVQPTFGAAHRLGRLPAAGIGAMLMELDMRAIQVPQLPLCATGEQGQQLRPQPARTPAPPARVNRTPRSEQRRHVAPRAACAQHIPNRCNHEPVVLPWSSASVPICQSRLLRPLTLIFLAEPKGTPATLAAM